MISPEEAIRQRIYEAPGMASVYAKRVYPQIAPQGVVLPYLTYTRISGSPIHHLRGPDTLARARIQVDIFSSTYSQMLAIAAATRKQLDGFRGAISVGTQSVHFSHLFLDSEQVQMVGPLSGSEDPIHRFIQDFVVAYRQDVVYQSS